MSTSRKTTKPENRSTLQAYLIGFFLSLMLTAVAYFSVVNETFSGRTLLAVVVGLAVAQLLVQLIFFLHLGSESKPRLNLTIFAFMVLVVGIIVIGSLWIMNNLNYHMTPHDMNEHLLQEYNRGGI